MHRLLRDGPHGLFQPRKSEIRFVAIAAACLMVFFSADMRAPLTIRLPPYARAAITPRE